MNINVTFREEQNNLDMSVKETDIFGVGFGSGGGTTDYNKLIHKPSINNVTLEGNKTSEELGLLTEDDLAEAVDPIKEELDTDIEAVDAKADKKAPAIYSTASGDIASFADGADDMPMTSVVATITPKQDLNGYDHPWVDGAGKNLLPPVESGTTINGITFTVDEQGVVTATGTASGGVAYVATQKITLQANTAYILSGCPASGGTSSYRLDFRNATDPSQLDTELANVFDTGSGVTFTPTTTHDVRIGLGIANGYAIASGGITFKPMIRLASVSDSTYEPYENICPIEGYTGMRTTVTGKNLLNQDGTDTNNGYRHGKYIDRYGNEQTSQEGVWDILEYVPVKPSTAYTISGHTANNANGLAFYDSSKQKLSAVTLETAPYTFTTPADCYYVRCNRRTTTDNAMQIELGTTSTDYEEYAGSTTTVSWQTEAGTVYSGTVDAVSGKLVVDKVFKQYSGANTEHWTYSTWTKENTLAAFANDDLADAVHGAGTSNYMCITACNELHLTSYSGLQNDDVSGITISGGGPAYVSIRVPKTIAADVEALRTYFASHPLQIVYELASPITYQLSPQQIKTLYAQNHVWTDVGEVSITYPTDTKLYVDNLFASIPTASGVSF